MNEMLTDMEERGVIEEWDSPWSSTAVLVRKKNGNRRFCVDYRKLHYVTKDWFHYRGSTTPWIRWPEQSGSQPWT
jgi:hypothetical protein